MSNASSVKNRPVNDEVLPSKIELLKDLIFGDNIQQYNSDFDEIRKDIHRKKIELEGLIVEVKSELDTLIDSTSTDINIRISELEDSLGSRVEKLGSEKVDKSVLGALLISLGEKISKG